MRPAQLTEKSFATYPPEARALAIDHLALFQQLPLSFLPLLLRELMVYDWKFPAEREDLIHQLTFLTRQDPEALQKLVAPFGSLRLTDDLESVDWVNVPAQFSEQLSAYLWASHQIDAFRTASVDYVRAVNDAKPNTPPAVRRLGMVLIGKDAPGAGVHLFKLLRQHGTFYSNVAPESKSDVFLEALRSRASANPIPFAHWYIDGSTLQTHEPEWTCISYSELRPVRNRLQTRMLDVMRPGGGGPELLRSELQRMRPEDVGLTGPGPVLSRFQLSLLTEGSGTQIFSTTFVQWAAREALRRAQPFTLLARFTPRRREASISPITSASAEALDADGSLIDADMGAYYTWINQQRLSGADKAGFVVWHEGHNQAMAIGPSFRTAAEEKRSVPINEVVAPLV